MYHHNGKVTIMLSGKMIFKSIKYLPMKIELDSLKDLKLILMRLTNQYLIITQT